MWWILYYCKYIKVERKEWTSPKLTYLEAITLDTVVPFFLFVPRLCFWNTLARIRLCVHLYIFSFSLSTISIIYYDVKHTSKMISYREIIFHYWNERRAYQRNNLEGVENEDKNQMWGQGGEGEMVSTFLKQRIRSSWEKPEWTLLFQGSLASPVWVNMLVEVVWLTQTGWVPQCRAR